MDNTQNQKESRTNIINDITNKISEVRNAHQSGDRSGVENALKEVEQKLSELKNV